MPSINSARYAQRIIQTESHESPSFLRKVHRLDPPLVHYITLEWHLGPVCLMAIDARLTSLGRTATSARLLVEVYVAAALALQMQFGHAHRPHQGLCCQSKLCMIERLEWAQVGDGLVMDYG